MILYCYRKDTAYVYDIFNKQLNFAKTESKLRTGHYKKLNALYIGQIGLLGKEIHYIAKKVDFYIFGLDCEAYNISAWNVMLIYEINRSILYEVNIVVLVTT